MNFLYETELRRETAVKISLAGFNFPVWDNFWLPLFTDSAVNEHSGRWGSKFDMFDMNPALYFTACTKSKFDRIWSTKSKFDRIWSKDFW